MTQDTTTEIAIPEDVMEAAMEAANTILRNPDQDDFSFEVDTIARAIMAERERCAKIAEAWAKECREVSSHDGRVSAGVIARRIRTPTTGADHE